MRVEATCVSCFILLAVAASTAQAQERVRISVNAGLQEARGKLTVEPPLDFFGKSGSFAIDDELGTLDIYDANAIVRIWKQAGFGAGISQTSTQRLNHQFVASVPSPIPGRLNTPVSDVTPQLAHSERSTYLLAAWTTNVTDRFALVFSGGPMFFELEQDLPDPIPVSAPTGAQTLIISGARHTASTTGFHFGLDLDYVFKRRAGGGVVIRYSRGSVDLPNGTAAMTLGGLQFSAGLRLKL